MLDVIRESWGWIGLEPAAIQATNDFGNVIVRHADGTYWAHLTRGTFLQPHRAHRG